MEHTYQPLPSGPLQSNATFSQPMQNLPEKVTLDSPAIDVMTDLKQVTAVAIFESDSIDDANLRMMRRGVRLLFVLNKSCHVIGLITATDILGEKPMRYLQSTGGTRHDVQVRNIMTPQDKLEVLCMADILKATVGQIVATLVKTGRQHALVGELIEPDKTQLIRGIFSASQISKQIGSNIHIAAPEFETAS